jgi:hypothetical protein
MNHDEHEEHERTKSVIDRAVANVGDRPPSLALGFSCLSCSSWFKRFKE